LQLKNYPSTYLNTDILEHTPELSTTTVSTKALIVKPTIHISKTHFTLYPVLDPLLTLLRTHPDCRAIHWWP